MIYYFTSLANINHFDSRINKLLNICLQSTFYLTNRGPIKLIKRDKLNFQFSCTYQLISFNLNDAILDRYCDTYFSPNNEIKKVFIKPSAENDFDLKERATFNSNEMNEHQLAEFAEQSDEIARQKSIVADERIHSANPNKNLTEKAFYESNQVMENVTSEDLLDQDSNRPKSEKVVLLIKYLSATIPRAFKDHY
ncbi:hypothetical protein BpHYR1_030137 [Brachionus plicatilis]|uniref:Uncharacterized protein n=1 Tax=Brachionus plicatilis TaxID=10195 RepID=A0A3M7RM36_BRAPC|nr:hypothetical protein BpHYR1_030137 [Brachionus plicatilis]